MQCQAIFLSTLSLRRATLRVLDGSKSSIISIHALLAESDHRIHRQFPRQSPISIHALLAESDKYDAELYTPYALISIHALLAESDDCKHTKGKKRKTFLSTLSLRRATAPIVPSCPAVGISIHALLAESDGILLTLIIGFSGFLSTLSLRRATKVPLLGIK